MPESGATVGRAVRAAVEAGLPRLEAHMLVLHALGRSTNDRAWLLAHDGDRIDAAALGRVQAGTARRLRGEPVAYITGVKAFHGLELRVDARVLDPRDDTETLVDWALELLPAEAPLALIDLGTGSGAIALALQKARPRWQVHACDRSADALAVAQANAHALRLPLQWHQGDWLAGIGARFDAIVSNPPYIRADDPHLAALAHEPSSALVGGSDGLDDIRRIIGQAPAHLVPGGWLLLEHGYDQAPAVTALLRAAGFASVHSRKDLAGIARCSGGLWPTAATAGAACARAAGVAA